MGEQLRTATQEKQTCAICLRTIRKNAVWWHVTECRHFYHWDCWHTYRKHECARGQGTYTRVRCPACRHPQISEAEFMAVMVPIMERALGGAPGATFTAAPNATLHTQQRVDESPLCSGGFDGIDIEHLMDVHKLLGIDGGVALDTRIIDHSCYYMEDPPYDHEIVVTVGVSGSPITLEDITRALMSIPRDAWQPGRSYYWEGVTLSPGRREARVVWGS